MRSKIYLWIALCILLCFGQAKQIRAATKWVDNAKDFESALSSPGEIKIVLKKDIVVSHLIRVNGRKSIDGGGKYRIRRKTKATYKGTLLWMQGEYLKIENVTVNGSGKSAGISGDINGRLLEVASGTVTLQSGARLCANYNLTSFTDGGGGITIHSGGKVVMKEGSIISDNLSITGGSGVRIEKGGSFVMEGGTIRDNVVVGQRAGTDFDGRGGAIHNRGEMWICGGTLSGNCARGYRQGENDGGFGGAIYNQNQCRITGGKICENQATLGGAIYSNEMGKVLIDGGEICDNHADRGRGGGIYISAATQIHMTAGKIHRNKAMHGSQIFLSSTSSGVFRMSGGSVEGDGTAVWNNGAGVILTGGEISSEDCALRNVGTSEIRGGRIEGKQKGIYHIGGTLCLSGNLQLNRIVLGDKLYATVDQKIHLKGKCEIEPEQYSEGRLLIRIVSGQSEKEIFPYFSLKKYKRYILESKPGGLYIGREKYRIQFAANGGQGTMEEIMAYVDEKLKLPACSYTREGYGFVGWSVTPVTNVRTPQMIQWKDQQNVKNLAEHGQVIVLYALWVKIPMIYAQTDPLNFYEEEWVDSSVLTFGVTAKDEIDGDLTSKIKISRLILPDHTEMSEVRMLPTDSGHLGQGKIHLIVTNSFGISGKYIVTYQVLANTSPELTAPDRYMFVDDNEQGEAFIENLKHWITMCDDVETEEELRHEMKLSWEKMDLSKAGSYVVNVTIHDQYGHRFYMKAGEQKRYGTGKTCEKTFQVHVVQRINENDSDSQEGYVRFVSPESVHSIAETSFWRSGRGSALLQETFSKAENAYEEVWKIGGEDKKEIKQFVKGKADPFSSETNQQFLEKFSSLKVVD